MMWRSWDVRLSGLFVVATLVEVWLRPDLAHRPAWAALGIALAVSVAFRRRYPLGATAVAFGLATGVTLIRAWLDWPGVGPYTSACILLLPYSLFRWVSPRHVLVGVAFIAGVYAASALNGEFKN